MTTTKGNYKSCGNESCDCMQGTYPCIYMNPRFSVEPEYELQEGCRCGSCYERTGRWKVCDINDIEENQYFDTEEEANKKCEELNKATEELSLCFKGSKDER